MPLDDGSDNLSDPNSGSFIDKVTNYQIWAALGGVNPTNCRGKIDSNGTSWMWDEVKGGVDDDWFSVLIEGQRHKQGKVKVAPLNHQDAISWATRRPNGNQRFDEGQENLFAEDFKSKNKLVFHLSCERNIFNPLVIPISLISCAKGETLYAVTSWL